MSASGAQEGGNVVHEHQKGRFGAQARKYPLDFLLI